MRLVLLASRTRGGRVRRPISGMVRRKFFTNLNGRPSVARFCFVQVGDRWSLNDGPAHCVLQSNSHAPAREILQNLFAFVIFLSHCSGILIDVKGIPPRHQRMPPTTARLRWNRTGTCIAALPLRPCMFAQTKRSHLRGCFSYFPPKKKAASAVFFVSWQCGGCMRGIPHRAGGEMSRLNLKKTVSAVFFMYFCT